jgi:hypothetical protein
MVRSHDAARGILDRAGADQRGLGPDAAVNRRNGHLGGIAPGPEAQEGHRDRGARGVADVPAITERTGSGFDKSELKAAGVQVIPAEKVAALETCKAWSRSPDASGTTPARLHTEARVTLLSDFVKEV